MAVGDITWPNYQATISTAVTFLDPNGTLDFLQARLAVARAKLIATGLGDSVSAQGTSVALLAAETNSVLTMITELEIRYGMKNAAGRFIKMGAADTGHRKGWNGGILHP